MALTGWSIVATDFLVVDEEKSYEQGLDYRIDGVGRFIPLTPLANKTITVLYNEMFPAYQCSTNQQDWSPAVMLDESRPYIDGVEYKSPIIPEEGRFPITDEAGHPLGLTIRLSGHPRNDFYLRVETQVASLFGTSATLEVELDRPAYLNGFHVTPFATFPVQLRSILAEGLTTDTGHFVWQGNQLVDLNSRPAENRAKKLYLLRAENGTSAGKLAHWSNAKYLVTRRTRGGRFSHVDPKCEVGFIPRASSREDIGYRYGGCRVLKLGVEGCVWGQDISVLRPACPSFSVRSRPFGTHPLIRLANAW